MHKVKEMYHAFKVNFLLEIYWRPVVTPTAPYSFVLEDL